MPAVQRNGRSRTPEEKSRDEIKVSERSDKPATPSRRPSPYLLLIYPLILAAGSGYSILYPAATSLQPWSLLTGGVPSDSNAPLASAPTSYFAGKRNVFNLYFVKIGWFWTSLAFVLLQMTARPPPSHRLRGYLQTAARYGIITLSWFLTTQWLFGPPLIDRSFTMTGGRCEVPNMDGLEEAPSVLTIASGQTCKAAGGRWHGGHDISGHVFMLVLSSAFLLYELYITDRASAHPSVSAHAATGGAHDVTEEGGRNGEPREFEYLAQMKIWSRCFLYAVVLLDLWMLLMTAVWFHTWLEKLSGLVLASATIWSAYFLADSVPPWGYVVGGI